jgi:VanZ family protein
VPGLLLLAIALVIYGSLYPWDFDFHRQVDPLYVLLHSWPDAWSRFVARDIALNVLLYIPVGALAFLSMRPRRRMRFPVLLAAIALGFALSTSMELLQVYDDHRVSSLLDIATNTAGTVAGALMALLFAPAVAAFAAAHTRRLDRAGALLAALWAGFMFYPFFPVFSSYRLRAELAQLWHGFAVSPVRVWDGAAEWFALALALTAVAGRLRPRWLAGIMSLLPLRFMIVTRTVAWNDMLAAGLALVLWSTIPEHRHLRAGIAIVLSAVLVYELAPFHWQAATTPFSWIPFAPTFESERQSAVVIVARKAFDYGAAVWVLHQAGWRYKVAGSCVAAALFALELLQRHLPGRTPETTDAVIALLMAGALWLAGNSRQRRGLG